MPEHDDRAKAAKTSLKLPVLLAGVAIATVALLLFVAGGCGDETGESDASEPETADSPVDAPVVNIQFVGAADLSDESKSSLAELVERIQAGVV